MDTEISVVAMHVILNACSGRDKVDKAFAHMAEFRFEEAESLLKEAEEDMLKAHQSQTEMIQRQAGGEDTEYSLLFIHAQDTLMTSNSELRIAKNMLPVLRNQHDQIQELKSNK